MIRTLTCSVLASALISVGIGVANADTEGRRVAEEIVARICG